MMHSSIDALPFHCGHWVHAIALAAVMAGVAVAQDRGDDPTRDDEQTAPDTTEPKALPSLDELLGLEPADREPGAEETAERERRQELERQLAEAQLADSFVRALEKMGLSADLLEARLDPGLGTQRVQEDILAKLDQLIDRARKMRRSSRSSGSSSRGAPDEGGMQQPGRQQQQSRTPAAGGSSPGQPGGPPPREDGAINTILDETRAEWGNLPDRVREMMLQGQSGTKSKLYLELTNKYYERLAREASL